MTDDYKPEEYNEYLRLRNKYQNTGHWIEKKLNDREMREYFAFSKFYCSECNDWQTYGKMKFCPNCGAKMEGIE